MELISTADERVFKKRTKLIVIKILLLLDCVHDAISAADVSCRDAPALCIYLRHYRNCIASGEDDLEYHG